MVPPVVSPDPHGFPELVLPAIGLRCHLFPFTKVQYDFYLGGVPGIDRAGYEEMLKLSPRMGWHSIGDWPSGVFAVGAKPDEIAIYTKWAREGFRLPTASEWARIDAALTDAPTASSWPIRKRFHPAATSLVKWAQSAGRRGSWRSLGLFEDGFLEWTRCDDGGFGLHGRPRSGQVSNIHNPQVHPPIRLLKDERNANFAFRLVRPLQPGDVP